MLVLSRKQSERIRLGDSIVVTIVRVSATKSALESRRLMCLYCEKSSSRIRRRQQTKTKKQPDP